MFIDVLRFRDRAPLKGTSTVLQKIDVKIVGNKVYNVIIFLKSGKNVSMFKNFDMNIGCFRI